MILSAVVVTMLVGCARQESVPAGMHEMPNGEMMMDHDMQGMHRMPDGSMMADSDAAAGMDMDGMPCCKKGPNGMECPMMKGMDSMDHDDMTMGDMVDMLKGKTGDELDAAFLEGMIPHHQGAVDMAELILENAKHEELRAMARDIIEAQQREIDMMKGWQKEWGYVK